MSAPTATVRRRLARNDERAAAMYRRYQAGLSLKAVAREFGVTHPAVHYAFKTRGYRIRGLKEANRRNGGRSQRDRSILRPADPADCRRRWELRARQCDEEASVAAAGGDDFEARRWARRARDWRAMIADLPRETTG